MKKLNLKSMYVKIIILKKTHTNKNTNNKKKKQFKEGKTKPLGLALVWGVGVYPWGVRASIV